MQKTWLALLRKALARQLGATHYIDSEAADLLLSRSVGSTAVIFDGRFRSLHLIRACQIEKHDG